MSSRNIPNKAPLKPWAMLDAGCVPKPSRRSDTKKSVLPLPPRCVAGEDNAQLPPILRRHCQLIKVIGRIIAEEVDGLSKQPSRCAEDGEVVHGVRESRLDFAGPLGTRVRLSSSLRICTRQMFLRQPREKLRALIALEVARKLVDFARSVDGERLDACGVRDVAARPSLRPLLCGATC
eukprot:2887116-Pleurochrysis_carterae.AAC.1